jgi:hypothetical protein
MPTAVFNYQGYTQPFTLPPNVVSPIYVELRGAGGPYAGDGAGGKVTGWLDVDPGQRLYISVGGVGAGPQPYDRGYGGWGGGGNGGLNSAGGTSGWGGSGASDISTVSNDPSTRLVVAGGAGATGRNGTNSVKGAGGPGGGGNGTGATGAGGGDGGFGGTQTAGGLGGNRGNGVHYPATDGAFYSGGNGGDSSQSTSSGGGAGGGGWYGGGAGGNGVNDYGSGGGAGGSNRVDLLRTDGSYVATDSRGGGSAQGKPGYVSITFDIRPDITPTNSWGMQAGLAVGGSDLTRSGISVATFSTLGLNKSIIRQGIPPMIAQTSLVSIPGASSVFNAYNMVGQAALQTDGFEARSVGMDFSINGSLTLQETLGRLALQASSTLAIGSSVLVRGNLVMNAVSSFIQYPTLLIKSGLSGLSGGGKLAIGATDTLLPGLSIDAKGSVSFTGRVLQLRGVRVDTHGSMQLTGALRINQNFPMSALAELDFPPVVVHFGQVDAQATATMSVGPSQTEFVGPMMSGLAELRADSQITNVTVMRAIAKLICDLEQGSVLDAPYLVVTEGPATMSFFTNRHAGLRNKVTYV